MKRIAVPLALPALLLLALFALRASSACSVPNASAVAAQAPPAKAASNAHAADESAQIVASAKAFLATLDETQRKSVRFEFDDAEQRARWSNLPTGIFQRRGLSFGALNAAQREAALKLLAAELSHDGYEKVLGIVEADEVLRKNEGGRGPAFGRDEFYVSFLGAPSEREPWMLQFGGHHLALNITMVGAQGVLTPSLTAVQPASYTVDGKTVRPLGREIDKAFALVSALDDAQRKQAVLGFQVRDLVLGPGQDGKTIQPEGIRASALNAAQREMLLDLAHEWIGILHDAAASEKLSEVRAQLDDTWFAWSGSLEAGKAAYFRVQGPTLVIEYAPQRSGGETPQHIHTIYRDPTNDYGKKLLGK